MYCYLKYVWKKNKTLNHTLFFCTYKVTKKHVILEFKILGKRNLKIEILFKCWKIYFEWKSLKNLEVLTIFTWWNFDYVQQIFHQGCHFTWKNMEFDNLGKKKTWNLRNFEKNLDFEQKTWKNLEFLRILTCSVIKFRFD